MTRDEIFNMPAGREMDWSVANLIMNFNGTIAPNYSTDIAAAWEVVEKLQEIGWSIELTEHANPMGNYQVQFWRQDDFSEGVCAADTAPLAICRAALLAVMENQEKTTTDNML